MKKWFAAIVFLLALIVAGSIVLPKLLNRTEETGPIKNETQSGAIPVNTVEPPANKAAERYITLEHYTSDQSSYQDFKKVYFFHASWCPICQSIESDILKDTTVIPENTVFIKTDFDSNTDLRQKYGVTYQYTFVQVDNEGNELKQWSATNLTRALAGIQ